MYGTKDMNKNVSSTILNRQVLETAQMSITVDIQIIPGKLIQQNVVIVYFNLISLNAY